MIRIALFLFCLGSSLLAQERPVFPLWEGKPPGETKELEPESLIVGGKGGVARVSNVTKPRITHFKAPAEKRSGASVVVCPGGGYNILAIEHEGSDICEWLNGLGVDAFLLHYRVPRRDKDNPQTIPLMDVQRAISMIRSKAGEMKLDSKRIGVLGFSAGGNLAAFACTSHKAKRGYPTADVDKHSCRPDFGILVYPAYLTEKDGTLRKDLVVDKDTPPIFFAHADTDRITSAGSAVMYLALKKAGVSSELHIYADGGHGFGMRMTEHPGTFDWTLRADEWMENRGFSKKK